MASQLKRYGVERVINALGTSTIVGANVVAPEVIAVAAEAMAVNMEIDELQRAASRVISRVVGSEAACITSSASSAIAITCAAAMTGADLARIVNLPDTTGLRDEVLLQLGHDLNFGARISQMARLSGARVVYLGTANHCDAFYLRGALTDRTAAVLFVVNGAVPGNGDFLPLEETVAIAARLNVPVIVDAAGEPDVRPFLQAGADLVLTSAHKAMGAPTSGVICGRKELVRACYLQNWGIGRAMKVGKEGIAGAIAAVERWYARDQQCEDERFRSMAARLATRFALQGTRHAHRVAVRLPEDCAVNARQSANLLREGTPPVWVQDAAEGALLLDLRALREEDMAPLMEALDRAFAATEPPRDDVPYHDLYWSEKRLLSWPD